MLKWLLSSIYFFLPAYLTNMTPSITASRGIFRFLNKPIDFGKSFRGAPLLGDHKTWRALLGLIVGILTALLQVQLFSESALIREISFFDYRAVNIWYFGFLMSFGAICGDLFFALIKRRLKLNPGARFLPFDQINYVLGAAFFLTFFSKITINNNVWITILIFTPLKLE